MPRASHRPCFHAAHGRGLNPQPTGPQAGADAEEEEEEADRGPDVANMESSRSGRSPPQVGQMILGAESLLRIRRSKRASQSGHWYS